MTDLHTDAADSSGDLIAISGAVSRLLEAADLLLDVQGISDPTWLPLSQAMHFCDAFCRYHPTMTVVTLVDGLNLCTDALVARAEWETPQ